MKAKSSLNLNLFLLLMLAWTSVALAQSQHLPATISMTRFAYSISDDSRLAVYMIDKNSGQERNVGYVLAPGVGASSLALDPHSRFIYVTNSLTNDVAAFTTNQPQFPKWAGNTPAGAGPSALVIDPLAPTFTSPISCQATFPSSLSMAARDRLYPPGPTCLPAQVRVP